jgi:hypothetical protein
MAEGTGDRRALQLHPNRVQRRLGILETLVGAGERSKSVDDFTFAIAAAQIRKMRVRSVPKADIG